MGVLRSIESGIESLVEGVFGRVFRSPVQPVEIARKLAKEMDEHKSVSVSRVYVPNEYLLFLSSPDRSQLPIPEEALLTELADYLTEHARREGYALLARPRVLLDEDADLAVGEFGIATRMAPPRRPEPNPPSPPTAVLPTVPLSVPEPAAPAPVGEQTEALPAEEADRLGLARRPATLTAGEAVHELAAQVTTVGRSRENDIVVGDSNVSRQHAEILQEAGGYWVVDLGSTNGTQVNDKRIDRVRLLPGDRVVFGASEFVFDLPA